MDTKTHPTPELLLGAEGLLAALFEPDARPSIRWVRYQTKRKRIPFYRIGGLVRFDPGEVRKALARDCLVTARHVKAGGAV